jgi:guanosine-3',5'-bis(diphosphate) 3'-pyrophosphohydrolase
MSARARSFAIAAHGEQTYGDKPYACHLDAVAALAAPYGDVAVVVAYLHDTVEDTTASIQDIDTAFGAAVAACVSLLTDEAGVNRKERKAKTYAKLADAGGELEVALIVKAADRLANVRACVQGHRSDLLKLYRREHQAFRQAVYREQLCDPIWNELDHLIAADTK